MTHSPVAAGTPFSRKASAEQVRLIDALAEQANLETEDVYSPRSL